MRSAQSITCLGHKEREDRRNKIGKLAKRSSKAPDETCRVLIKKAPVAVETSLKELEDIYEMKPEWKLIEEGGVLSIPVEELRMENLPRPDRSGQVVFKEKKGGGGKQIEYYPVGQTIDNMNALIGEKYQEEKKNAQAAGNSVFEAEKKAFAEATKLPQFQAVKSWQDTNAEIKLKKAIEKMMAGLKIPALLIRSIKSKEISALNDLGLKLPGEAEIDIMMAYLSGDFLHVVVCEVKRSDTYPWQTQPRSPNKQAVNKAENQLTKDLDVLMAILAGIPPDQIVFHTLACFPDSSITELQTIFCTDCLENEVVCQEDLSSLSLLEKKTQVAGKPDPATTNGKHHLLTLTARCLCHHSTLHSGYREVADQEHLATERQKYNIQTVDRKLSESEFVVFSPQQQQAIDSFTIVSSQRHLVLTGAAGTGKTLVALQVANNLIQALEATAEPGEGPVLLVTAYYLFDKERPLLKHLDANTTKAKTKLFDTWERLVKEYGVSGSPVGMQLLHLTHALSKRWEGRRIFILADEFYNPNELDSLVNHHASIPPCVTLILIVNPRSAAELPTTLPDSFLRINLATPYRSTIAITSLARFIAKFKGAVFPEGDFGSDVKGKKPIMFDVGNDEVKLREALERSRALFGNNTTLLYDIGLTSSMREICLSYSKERGGALEVYKAGRFFGWEAERVVAVTVGAIYTLEMATRAKTRLSLILVEGDGSWQKYYARNQKHFEDAATKGLVELMDSANEE